MIRAFIFIGLYLLVYGGMHLYFYSKLRGVVVLGPLSNALLLVTLGVLLLLPMAIWQLESIGLHGLVKPLAWLGYLWMGFLFLFLSLHLVADLLVMGLKLLHTVTPFDLRHTTPSRRVLFIVFSLLVLPLMLYGYISAQTPRLERVVISSERVPQSDKPYRIVLLSDLHLGVMVGEAWLVRLVERVNKLDADLIVASGDVIDSHIDGSSSYLPILNRLQARDGRFAVTGNHEFFAGIDKALGFLRQAGFEVLRGERAEAQPWLRIVGVDDWEGGHMGVEVFDRAADLLPQLSEVRPYTILLKHQPLLEAGTLGRFDLQLSGHVHQGQIFPFVVLTKLFYPYPSGMSNLGKGSRLYLSRGTGTWGPPLRVFAPAEITLFELVAPEE